MEEKVTEHEPLESPELEEAGVLIDSGAIAEQTKGDPRGRWIDHPPIPYISTRT